MSGAPAAEEQAFLQAILASSGDDLPKLIYADWLDEHGHAGRAELIRLAHARHVRPSEWEREGKEDRLRALLAEHGGPYQGAVWFHDRFQRCNLIDWRWAGRTLRLTGWVDATVAYNSLGGDDSTLLVNGVSVEYQRAEPLVSLTAAYLFPIPSPDGSAHARLESNVAVGLPWGGKVHLYLGACLVYSEG